MKQKSVRSELAGALAVTMFYVPSWKVSAADSIPLTGNRERKENLPGFGGHRIRGIRARMPEADEGTELPREKMSLQEYNTAYKSARANPVLGS